MKKIYTLLCIAATMLAACAKENIAESGEATPQDEEVKYIDVTFGAEFPVPAELQDNAKTMLNNDLSVSWSEGDQIAVNGSNYIAPVEWGTLDLDVATVKVNPEDPHKATFTAKVRESAKSFFALYPSTDVELGKIAASPDGKMYTVLPNVQTATKGSFTNGCALSYARGSVDKGVMQNTVEFQNLCAILEFTMPDYVIDAQSVNIKSNNETTMSGGCVIDRTNYTFQSFNPSSEKKPVFDNVTVNAPNTADKFYAVIFPGNYASGFNITVTTADSQTYSLNVSKPLNAQANHIYNLGTLGVVLDEGKVDLAVNIEQNIKTGSVATFNIAANGDFKAMVKSWDISLYNSDDKLVRKIEGNTTGSGTLDVVGDYKLLAAGDYYATVTYFMQTGSKRDALSFTGIKAQPFKVEGVVINATPTLNYDGGPLNGTDVQLSFDTSAVDPDLAKLINWTDITLTDENRVTYRTATAAGKMTPAEGKPYLPNGEYTLTAYFTLPELGSYTPTALDPKTITVNLTPTFGVKLTSAKTSYDYYKAGDVNKANDCKNMGIYELAANITNISISNEVVIQMKNAGKFNYEWFLDDKSIGTTDGNNSVSNISKNTDDAVQVDSGKKNVNCTLTFDNIVKESDNITVDITGLPFNKSMKDTNWSFDGNHEWNGNSLKMWRGGGSNPRYGKASYTLYVTDATNVTVNYSLSIYSCVSVPSRGQIKIGETNIIDEEYKKSFDWGHKDYSNTSYQMGLTAGDNIILLHGYSNSTSATNASTYALFHSISVIYR